MADLSASEIVEALQRHHRPAAGMVTRREVPDGCGLVHIQSDGKVFKIERGARNPEPVAPEGWIASLLRTAAEQRSMGWRCSAHACHAAGDTTLRVGGVLLAFCPQHRHAAEPIRLGQRALSGVA